MELMLRFCDSRVGATAILTRELRDIVSSSPKPRCHSDSDQRSEPFLAEGSALGNMSDKCIRPEGAIQPNRNEEFGLPLQDESHCYVGTEGVALG